MLALRSIGQFEQQKSCRGSAVVEVLSLIAGCIPTGGGVVATSGVTSNGDSCGMWKERHKSLEIWCLDFSRMSHHLDPCQSLSVRKKNSEYLAMPEHDKMEERGVGG